MKKRKISPLYVIIAFIFFSLLAIFYVKNIIEVNQLNLDISELKKEINKQNLYYINLTAERDKLTSRERIVYLAKTKLGMVFPTEPIIIIKK